MQWSTLFQQWCLWERSLKFMIWLWYVVMWSRPDFGNDVSEGAAWTANPCHSQVQLMPSSMAFHKLIILLEVPPTWLETFQRISKVSSIIIPGKTCEKVLRQRFWVQYENICHNTLLSQAHTACTSSLCPKWPQAVTILHKIASKCLPTLNLMLLPVWSNESLEQ